jgi:hypothetical protein
MLVDDILDLFQCHCLVRLQAFHSCLQLIHSHDSRLGGVDQIELRETEKENCSDTKSQHCSVTFSHSLRCQFSPGSEAKK